ITYWSFRFMIGLGVATMLGALAILFAIRRGRVPGGKGWLWLAIAMPLAPLAANSFGWIFTEMGRQPWAVFGLMTTERAVSPGVSVAEASISLISLTLLYAALAVVEVGLMLKYIRRGADPFVEPPDPRLGASDDEPLTFAY
ncbi:MAG: cytochrome ubiquinol oxidase subunit I, partial [Aeromicrobium sp.]